MFGRVLAIIVVMCSSARGDVVLGNLSDPLVTSTLFGSGSTVTYKAVGLEMPAERDFRMGAVTLSMNFPNPSPRPEVAIWSGQSAPSQLLTSLTATGPLTGAGEFTFISPGEFVLEGGRRYWLRMSAQTGSPQFLWSATSINAAGAPDPTGVAQYLGFLANGAPSGFKNRFQIVGWPVRCGADLTGSSDPDAPGYGVPDGVVDISDFFYFLDQFVAGNLEVADLTGSSDMDSPWYGAPDGVLDLSDLFYFLDRFFEGCR